MINREDMLALTRRMTVKRTSMTRIAGGYLDRDGYIDGTFNTGFLKLSPDEKEKNLQIAKVIPFADTNQNLKEYAFSSEKMKGDSMWKLLMGMRVCGLKNDALMETFYEIVGEQYQAMVAEEEQYQRNTGDLRVYQEELLDILQDAGVRDADIWLKQLAALVDKREMVEVKHSLNVRRQKLREGMKSNEEQRQNSFTCVKGILTEYPELKEQAKEVLTSYHIAV